MQSPSIQTSDGHPVSVPDGAVLVVGAGASGAEIALELAASMPGLYFVGMPFQFGLTSQLLAGVGRDAGFVAGRIAERQRVDRATVSRR